MPSLFSMTGGTSQKYYSQHIKEPEFLHGKCMLNFSFTALASCLNLYDSFIFIFIALFSYCTFFLQLHSRRCTNTKAKIFVLKNILFALQ